MTMVSFLLVYLYGVHNTIGNYGVQDIHQVLFIRQSVTSEVGEVQLNLGPFSPVLTAVPDPLGGKLKNIDYSHNICLPLTN